MEAAEITPNSADMIGWCIRVPRRSKDGGGTVREENTHIEAAGSVLVRLAGGGPGEDLEIEEEAEKIVGRVLMNRLAEAAREFAAAADDRSPGTAAGGTPAPGELTESDPLTAAYKTLKNAGRAVDRWEKS